MIGAQLIQEIETLPKDGLQARAIAILKAKNRLSADDARRVEVTFAARMALQAVCKRSGNGWTCGRRPNRSSTAPTPGASTGVVKGPRRGRSRRVKAVAEQSAPAPVTSKLAVDDNQPASAPLQSDAGSTTKIQKCELTISEPRRHRDKAHLKFVASQPCLVCGRSPADAHHLRFTQLRAMGRKVSDEFTVPLCRTHHRDNHRFGDEASWWATVSIDPVEVSRRLWVSTRQIE